MAKKTIPSQFPHPYHWDLLSLIEIDLRSQVTSKEFTEII